MLRVKELSNPELATERLPKLAYLLPTFNRTVYIGEFCDLIFYVKRYDVYHVEFDLRNHFPLPRSLPGQFAWS
ncbi:MAG: hypothetical protein AAGF85_03150 [Bacteroidota bacterium]